MKRFKWILISIMFAFVMSFSHTAAFAAKDGMMNKADDITLTEQQKAELEKLHTEMVELKKEIIKKHVEYGTISKEKGDKILEKIEMKYEKIRNNNFMPDWNHHKKCDEMKKK